MNEKLWKPIVERVEYKASNGVLYEFICYYEKQKQVYVNAVRHEGKDCTWVSQFLPITAFNVNDLKEFEVWGLLTESDQKMIEKNSVVTKIDEDGEVKEVKHRVHHSEYLGIPKEFCCKSCGGTKILAPAIVIARSKAKGQTVEDFEKNFECSGCKPMRKGKEANPKYKGLSKVLKCTENGCGVEKGQHPSMTIKAAEALNMTYSDYLASWKCKEHRTKKVHHFTKEKLAREARGEVKVKKEPKVKDGVIRHRGKKANPAYDGLPKGLTCHCGFFQVQHPSISIKVAGEKGIALEDYFKNWKCKEHRERKTKVKEVNKETVD